MTTVDDLYSPIKKSILIVGLDHVLPKVLNQAKKLQMRGWESSFFSRDFSEKSQSNCLEYGVSFAKEPTTLLKNLTIFIRLLQTKPHHVEFYLSQRSYLQLSQLIILFLLRIPFIVWCRGGELLNWHKHSLCKRFANRMIIKFSSKIIIKELWMKKKLCSNGLEYVLKKTLFLPNKVETRDSFRLEKKNVVIFVNSFKPWRQVHLVVEAASKVVQKIPDAVFYVVGGTSEGIASRCLIEYDLNQRVEKHNLKRSVFIEKWTDNPIDYYDKAKVFLLPADIVFINYSLLESMEQGVVPIVSDVDPGSARIIDDGVDGYIIAPDAEKIAEKIIELLTNEGIRKEMAIKAREKILAKFNLNSNVEDLVQLYELL